MTGLGHTRLSARRLVCGGIAGLVLMLGMAAAHASTARATTLPYSVNVSYADTVRANARDFPTPWSGSPNVIYEGCTGSCSFDTGGVELVNTSASSLSVGAVTIDFSSAGATTPCLYDIWPHNVTLPAGGTLIIAQTASGAGNGCSPSQGSMDSSDIGPNGAGWAGNCTQSGIVPVVNVTVNGTTTAFNDSGQVLNTAGVDGASCNPKTTNESAQWTPIGSVACPGAKVVESPPTQSLAPSSTATVTAKVTNGCGNPLSNVAVGFTVVSGPNTGKTGQATTNANGSASFSYSGGAAQGIDRVRAVVTNTVGSIQARPVSVAWRTAVLTLSASQAAPGSTLTFTGSGYQAGETVNLSLGAPTGQQLTSVVADGTGAISGSFVVPKLGGGQEVDIVAVGATSALEGWAPLAIPLTLLSTTHAAGATGVNYVVTYESVSGLTGGQDTITLSAPAGTVFSGSSLDVNDLTAGTDVGSSGPTLTNSGATATWTVNGSVSSGDRVRITAFNVTNPPAGTYTLGLATSQDPTAVKIGDSITAAKAVLTPTVSLSSTAAGAPGVLYRVYFTPSSTGALAPNQGTITLNAPAGTVFPSGGIDVYDVTAASDLGGTYGANLTNSGATASWTVPFSVPAGHRLRLTIGGVTNPGSGSQTMAVTTSSDTVSASTPAYAIVSPQAVGSPTLTMSTSAANATAVIYRLTFTTSPSGELYTNQGTITVNAPSGTVIPGNGVDLVDLTTGRDYGGTYGAQLSNSGATATWALPWTIPASHKLRITITGVQNPGAGTGYTLGVLTSSDSVAASTPSYSIAAAVGVGSPSLSMSSPTASAPGVTYRVSFTTSTAGALIGGQGTITLQAPAGTVFSGNGIDIYDATTGTDLGGTWGPSLSNSNATATWTVGNTVPPGHHIELTITDVQNPAAGTGDQLGISTTSDTVNTLTPGYQVFAAKPLTSVAVSPTSRAANATGVSYPISFVTSTQGALEAGYGTITVQAPSGTVIPGNGVDVFDITTGKDLGGTYGPSLSNSGATATWTFPYTIPASQHLRLTLTGVQNPPAVTSSLTVLTSSDAAAATPNYTITSPTSVTSPVLTPSTNAASATGVLYDVTFTTSSQGALVGGSSAITLSAPVGTVFSGNGLDVWDLTTGQHLGGSWGPTLSNSNASGTWGIPWTIPAGHQLELRVGGVQNPPAGSGTLGVSTSSDTAPANATANFVAATPVTSPSATLTSNAAGATGVTYTLLFNTTSTGALQPGAGQITVQMPSGTVISNNAIDVYDVTAGADLGGTYGPSISNGGATATWTVGGNGVPASHQIQLTIPYVVNPAAATGQQIAVSTSSNTPTAQTPPYDITAAQPLSGVQALLSNYAAGATGVTYHVRMTTSSTGHLVGGVGTITLTAPAGTVFSGNGLDVYDETSATDLGGTYGPTLSNGGATGTWTVGRAVPAGHDLEVTATGVTNPAAGSYALSAATSSDTSAAAGYMIGTGATASALHTRALTVWRKRA